MTLHSPTDSQVTFDPLTPDPYFDLGVNPDDDVTADIHFPPARFNSETVLILVSVVINSAALVVVNRARDDKTCMAGVYHLLYFNLGVTNVLACLLTWFGNNLMFLFNSWFSANLLDGVHRCTASVYSTLGVYISMSLGIQMTLAMVGLAVLQYIAICHPLRSLYTVQKRRARLFIAASALISTACALLPLGALTYLTSTRPCTVDLEERVYLAVIVTSDVYVAIIGLLYVTLAVIAVHVFQAIRRHRERQRKYQVIHSKYSGHGRNGRAFYTTLILLLSLTITLLPITLYFVYVLNTGGVAGVRSSVVILYLTMMPCLKCIADPIIYGSRMSDVARLWRTMVCSSSGGKNQYVSEDASISLSIISY